MLLAANRTASTPRPGAYVLWLASGAFDWSFPRHLHLYLKTSARMHERGGGEWMRARKRVMLKRRMSSDSAPELERCT